MVLPVLVAAAVVAFSLRRLIFLAASLLPPRSLPGGSPECESITLVISARNEVERIAGTLKSLSRVDYPSDRLFVALVNDASDDATGEQLKRWTSHRPRACTVDLAERVGKPRAIRRGVEAAPPSDLVAIIDADVELRPDALQRLRSPFADPTVGAVSGFLRPANAETSPTARYAAVETWVHQLVTSAAKDRLDLNPPTLGGAAVYRRTALAEVGWLGSAPSGDDIRATAALTRAGWRTRFVPAVVADNTVAHQRREYWAQHVRWARDVFETARSKDAPSVQLPLSRRVEMWMASAGYADRVAIIAAVGLCASGRLTLWIPAGYLALRGLEICVAVIKAGAGRGLPAFLVVTPAFFVLDVAASFTAAFAHLTRRPRVHRAPRRRSEPKFP